MPVRNRPLAAPCLLTLGLLLTGCTVVRETQPLHTATEELLVSHATEIAADKLAAALPSGRRAYVDDLHLKGEGADYAVSAIRAACLRHGLLLAPDRASSDIVVEVRMGAASIDSRDTVLGIPAVAVAIPGTLTAVPVPELSAYSKAMRKGTVELAAFAYDARTGQPVAFIGPTGGERLIQETKILTIFGSGSRVERPGAVRPDAPKR
jgi:hypothetical protein